MPTRWKLSVNGKPFAGAKVEKGLELARYIVPVGPDKFAGFTDDQSLLDWAQKKGQRKIYEDAIEGAKKAAREYERKTDSEKKAYEKEVADASKREMDRFDSVLKSEGVKPHEADKILKLAKEGKLGTLYLYKDYFWRGSRLPIATWKYVWRLSSYGFDNCASSAINTSVVPAILWQFNLFTGAAFVIPPFSFWPSLGWFNDRASSVSW